MIRRGGQGRHCVYRECHIFLSPVEPGCAVESEYGRGSEDQRGPERMTGERRERGLIWSKAAFDGLFGCPSVCGWFVGDVSGPGPESRKSPTRPTSGSCAQRPQDVRSIPGSERRKPREIDAGSRWSKLFDRDGGRRRCAVVAVVVVVGGRGGEVERENRKSRLASSGLYPKRKKSERERKQEVQTERGKEVETQRKGQA
ncbi:hypothetical protein MGYG_07830 [Nannizzia gypsea CBS 118893]|uniref:Uncharacterized protein n=1 Tax=Arthroderma gypseum (strain ATCC MYA-4604 / CBS 118893) TaxID=535722 RepID=E4V4A0_ARTGP|nr:hypothetical protein MGYG_07830 [Nannizzia gypsea CBS 118893]EFR04824.1 hypothetical protein MGYG_07830 [Nannizzia gypsea CBS 118893]